MKLIKSEYDSDCPVAHALHILGGKWTALILHNIFDGKNRFGQLQRAMVGISSKTLAQRLFELEKEGIISRKVFKEIPLHVEYSLTKKGKSLGEILETMKKWGKKH